MSLAEENPHLYPQYIEFSYYEHVKIEKERIKMTAIFDKASYDLKTKIPF